MQESDGHASDCAVAMAQNVAVTCAANLHPDGCQPNGSVRVDVFGLGLLGLCVLIGTATAVSTRVCRVDADEVCYREKHGTSVIQY